MALTTAGALVTAIAIAALLDSAYAEPPEWTHPIVLLGRVIAPFDRRWFASRSVGLGLALVLPLVAAGAAGLAVVGVWWVATVVGLPSWDGLAIATLASGVVLFTASSLRLLLTTVREVVRSSEADPDLARRQLRALAGRDAAQLSPAQIRSAAVESAAENLADGLIAPLSAFVGGALLANAIVSFSRSTVVLSSGSAVASPSDSAVVTMASLAMAAGAATWLKAVNTLDSMLGYPHKPLGWAPARLDDLAMWVPARLCAALLALAAGDPGALGRARTPARIPTSPNSGWPMATLAAVLDVELSKPGHYTLACGPALPTAADATRGVVVVSRAGWLAVVIAAASVGLLGWSVSGVAQWF